MSKLVRHPHVAPLLACAAFVGLGLSLVPTAPVLAQEAATWVDIDGTALPFQDGATVAEFLRSAEVTNSEKIDVGITGPRRLTLTQDGLSINAAFRDVDETSTRVRLADGTYFQKLRDYCGFEVAAYQISLLLQMDNIPPAAHRRVGRDDGTVQIWVADAMMEKDRVEQGLRSPDGLGWGRQIQEMMVLDELVGNVDRNSGNMLIDANWKVWLIDHTRAFQQGEELRNPGRIRMVRRAFWEALRGLDEASVTAVASNELDGNAIRDMLARRDLLVEHLQKLIDERGEGAVVWE